MLKTKIIVSDITNLTDARYFAAWGVEAMGFDLNVGSPNFNSPAQLNALREWISGPKIIGEFNGMQEKAEIDELLKLLQLEIVQLGPFAPADWDFENTVYREVVLNNLLDLPHAEAYIVKGDNGELLKEENIKRLKELCRQHLIYIDASLSADELLEIEEAVQPEGFVLRGGDEEKVGYKSFDELDEIMEALELE
jgi:phosphoribosylanthranilate isomerase